MITLPERVTPDSDHLHKLQDAFGADLRVSMPGIIKSFNAGAGTAVVQLSVREKQNINGVESDVTIPLLPDVPVIMPRAGGYMLTLPITVGDEVLVVFGDNCIDGWWQSGGVQNQMDRRRHDLSDCFAIPGPWSQPRKISNYSTNSAQLRNEAGTAYIDLNGTAITIKASTLNYLVDSVTYRDQSSGESGTISIGGANININGNGGTVIDGKQYLPHKHTGVQTGSGDTGGVA